MSLPKLGMLVLGVVLSFYLIQLMPVLLILLAVFILHDKTTSLTISDIPDTTDTTAYKSKYTEEERIEAIKELSNKYLNNELFTKPRIKQPPSGKFISREEKLIYLQSAKWGELRSACFARDNHKCLKCGSTSYLNCHHISYTNLGNEKLSELATLCESCHTALHNKLGYDRTTIYKI